MGSSPGMATSPFPALAPLGAFPPQLVSQQAPSPRPGSARPHTHRVWATLQHSTQGADETGRDSVLKQVLIGFVAEKFHLYEADISSNIVFLQQAPRRSYFYL